MAEQTLREQIAKSIARSRCEVCNDCGAAISTDNPDDVAAQVLALIKEAGYLSYEAVQTMLNTLSGGMPEILKIQGYVKKGE